MTGPYNIYNCGTHTAEVSILINTLLSILQPAIADVSKRKNSAAYTTFFKHDTFTSTVRDILSNITRSVPFPPGPHAIRNPPPDLFGPPKTPQFVCITDYNQMTWSVEKGGQGGRQFDAYKACTQSAVNAFGVFGTKFLENSIVLCPSFWAYPSLPPSPRSTSACLRVDPHFNRFRDTGTRLVNFQIWVLLQELALSYIYARSGSLIDVSTANDCYMLAASDAVNNARSYVYYVASRFSPVLYLRSLQWCCALHLVGHTDYCGLDIRLGCTDFPQYRRSSYEGTIPIHSGSVELLEIGPNTTSAGDSRLQNVSSYGGQSISNSSVGTNTLVSWPT